LKLGGGQFVAPSVVGETSAPGMLASFSGFPTGWPFLLISFVQLRLSMRGAVRMCLPFVRSSRKKWPLRLAWARSFLGLPSMTPSIMTGVCAASQSCVSCGVAW
jgi:hypothetical protein